jgi:hypothetical protein
MRDDESSAIAKILPIEREAGPAASSPVIGWLVDGDPPRVDFVGNPGGPAVPRWLAAVPRACAVSREVLLLFDGGRPECPIVIGWVAAEGGPVDDGRVEVEARDEVVLSCGKASLVLRRNGRVVIRGTLVEARSSGRTRITGTTVEIN